MGDDEDEIVNQPEVVDEDGEANRSLVRPKDYVFWKKSMAVVVEHPLFPYSNKIIHLGKYHAKVTNSLLAS